jgi:hypothetical protein
MSVCAVCAWSFGIVVGFVGARIDVTPGHLLGLYAAARPIASSEAAPALLPMMVQAQPTRSVPAPARPVPKVVHKLARRAVVVAEPAPALAFFRSLNIH